MKSGWWLSHQPHQPLWKMMEWKSVGMMKFPIDAKIKNVPNHQPDQFEAKQTWHHQAVWVAQWGSIPPPNWLENQRRSIPAIIQPGHWTEPEYTRVKLCNACAMGPLNSSFNEMNVWGQILSTFSTILLNQEAILVLGRVDYSWKLWSRGK